uniref:peptidylamidoglycolate lyase n=1 Tax=Aceria tosichella TaxID=561515 RepID=A0A6G1SDU0_9ACAR
MMMMMKIHKSRQWASLDWLLCRPGGHSRRAASVTSVSLVAIILLSSLMLIISGPGSRTSQALELGFLDGNMVDLDNSMAYQLDGQEDNLDLETDAHRLVARSKLFGGGSEFVQSGGYGSDNDNQIDTNDDQDLSSSGSWSSLGEGGNGIPSPYLSGVGVGPQEAISSGKEIYLLEDKDYPKSLFEDYPRRVGQVSGITTLPNNDVVIFHRSERQWNEKTFNESNKRIPEAKQENLIKNDTIMIIDREDGSSVASFGSNLFYMPHSIASDHLGNLWVSDVARHQVMRLPATNIRDIMERVKTNTTQTGSRHQIWPDIILGEAFVPGSDSTHFCQPSEIVVSSNGRLVYVADGYCNQRIMVFVGSTGKFLKSFGQRDNLEVVHSLTLIEEKNLLCVADREGARILCYNAGLHGDLARLGEPINQIVYPLGRVYAITSISSDHLLVSSNQFDTNRYDLAILNPFTHQLKLVWISSDLLEPHSLTTTRDREFVYAADVSKEAYKKVFKFDVIRRGM